MKQLHQQYHINESLTSTLSGTIIIIMFCMCFSRIFIEVRGCNDITFSRHDYQGLMISAENLKEKEYYVRLIFYGIQKPR